MSIYEKNLLAIQKKDERLYQALQKQMNKSEDICFYIDTAKNQELIVYAKQKEKIQYMNSRYNPQREAQRFAAQYADVVDYSYMIFFGLGNGMIAEEIIKTRGEHVTYLFYEPSASLFRLVLENFDLTALIGNPRVRIVVRSMNDEKIDAAISGSICADNYKISFFDVLPTYKNLFEEEEKELEQKYRFFVGLVNSSVISAEYFGRSATYNNIYNMRYVLEGNCEEDYRNVFPVDRPAVIVAAGPSLEKNVHHLKEAKGKFLIIAVDTALRYLVEQGIQPDLAVVADPQKPVELFEDERVQQFPLAVYTAANYEIVKLMKQKIIFMSSECDYYNKLFGLAGRHIHNLAGGGSVATFAFVLAVAWGYRTIVLIGQDLALAPDKVHAGNDDIDTFKLESDKIEIEGYYGDKVYTSPDYNFYKEWFEMAIKGNETLQVINATEGGAKIEGAIPMPLKTVIDTYDVEPFDFEKTIRDMPPVFSGEQKEAVIQMWRDSVRNLHTLKQKLYDGIRQITYGIEPIRRNHYKESELAKLQKRVNKIVTECNEVQESYFVDCMIAGQDSEEDDTHAEMSHVREDIQEVYREFERLLKHMKSMYSAVDEVREMFEKIIKETTETTGGEQ
jgi:hypothetical protein